MNLTAPAPPRPAKYIISAIGIMALSAWNCLAETVVSNSQYQISLNKSDDNIVIKRKNLANCYVRSASISTPVVSIKNSSTNDPIFGSGETMAMTAKDGAVTQITLFHDLPFIAVRKSLTNKTSQQLRINKSPVVSLDISFNTPIDRLMTRGTAGLKPLSSKEGSYVFSTIADPDSGSGIISAWVSFDRGSGIIFHGTDGEKITQSARIDYGDLRLDPGETEKGELLLIGLFDDVQHGLETYADSVKAYYDISLQKLPSAYCTWYHARASDEKRLAENVGYVEQNLKDFGLSVMQIDDQWQPGQTANGPKKIFDTHDPSGPYASGMKAAADNIKKHGMTPGIWFMPFAGSFNDPYFADKQNLFYKVGTGEPAQTQEVARKAGIKFDNLAQAPYSARWGGTCIDMSNPESRKYLHRIAQKMAQEWGYEYFKMDGLWTGTGTAIRYVNNEYQDDDLGKTLRFNPKITPIQAYRMGLDTLRDAAGEDIFFLGCCMVQNLRSFGASFGGFDAMRVGPDNGPNAKSLPRGPRYSTRYYFLNKRVWHNDPDPMYFRKEVSTDAARMLATWVTLSGTLGASSYDYYKLPPERIDILKRTMPSHTSLHSRPLDFLQNDIAHAWLLTDSTSGPQRILVGHFNWNNHKDLHIETRLSDIGLDPDKQYIGFDYWNNEFIAPFSGTLHSCLAPFSGRSIAVYPVENHPQLISTSRHITQGIVDIKKEHWSGNTLHITGRIVANDPYELRIAVPLDKSSWTLEEIITTGAPKGTTSTFKQDGPNIRITLKSPVTTEIELALKFRKGIVSEPTPLTLQAFNAVTFPDNIQLSWKSTGYGQGFRIKRDNNLLTTTQNTRFTDRNIKPKNVYTYTIETIGWNGSVTATRSVEVQTGSGNLLPAVPPRPDIAITALEPIAPISSGWGKTGINKSVSGGPLMIDGKKYDQGIGVHANSTIQLNIPEGSKQFVAVTGIDDAKKDRGETSVKFVVIGDVLEMGEPPVTLAESPILTNYTLNKWHFNIPIDERLKVIRLVVQDAGNGINSDHANWCDAGFIKQ